MMEMDILIQLSGWAVAFVTGIFATWEAFNAKKKDDLLVEVKNIVEDGKVEMVEVIDLMRKIIAEKE